MKSHIKAFLSLASLPLIIGVCIGSYYQNASGSTQVSMLSGITGFSNPYLFNQFVFLSLFLISIYVFIKGEVTTPYSYVSKFIFYWLPVTTLGFVVPFFGAMFGFIIGHPSSPHLVNLLIIGVVGFIWSVVFFIILILPAFSGFPPKKTKDKRLVYSAVLLAFTVAYIIHTSH